MLHNSKGYSGLVIAGLRGGSGKTIVSLGLTSAWNKKKIKVSCFKKGPDYIDAGWLSYAAGTPCYNLDTYLFSEEQVKKSFKTHYRDSDIAIVEGNRGLFDAIDTEGKTCTAELAKLLDLPTLLVVDCTKSTRTIAALLLGCMTFDPGLNIMGVILNQVAGKRHEGKVKDNIEKFCNIPVLGSIPKFTSDQFPERHMGLVTCEEHESSQECLSAFEKIAKENINLDEIYNICCNRSIKNFKDQSVKISDKAQLKTKKNLITIGIIKDSAFQFYYPDNIEALVERGVQIVYLSPLKQQIIPDLDAIYIGGGFPETHASQLAYNKKFRSELKKISKKGIPIYAECGGFIFLGESLEIDQTIYPMADILPVKFGLSKVPVGHGYTSVKVISENPFYEKGNTIRGHEFRYSTILDIDFQDSEMAFQMERGKGIIDKLDGFSKGNIFATYTHVHALTTPLWADGLVKQAIKYKNNK